jgi:hypothetical protein
MSTERYRRVLNQVCRAVGFRDADALAQGSQLRIDGHLVTFVHDDVDAAADGIAVYVDLGPVRGDVRRALEVLMQLNFSLGVGSRGVLSLHPQTRHLFYSFRYALTASASGQALLDTLIRCIGDVALDAAAGR